VVKTASKLVNQPFTGSLRRDAKYSLVVLNISIYQFQENILQWNVTVYPEIITYVLPLCGGLSGSHNWPFPRSTTRDFK